MGALKLKGFGRPFLNACFLMALLAFASFARAEEVIQPTAQTPPAENTIATTEASVAEQAAVPDDNGIIWDEPPATVTANEPAVVPVADGEKTAPVGEAQNPAPAADVPAAAGEEDLILQLIVDGIEMEDIVEGIRRGDRVFLPVQQLGNILDFSIKADPATSTATGWFIRQQNKFMVSPAVAEVKGKDYKPAPGQVFSRNGDIFVDAALLQEWWPLGLKTDFKLMTLDIAPRERLPFQEKLEREKRRKGLDQGGRKEKGPEKLKRVDVPYEAAGWPVTDLTFNTSYDSNSDAWQNAYSLYSVGDFGFLTSRVYAAGDLSNDALSDLRVSFGRDDYEKKLLGPLKASSFRFGDIDSASLSQVATPTLGSGFTVTNRALDRPDNFDVTNFIGDSQPGWDVELYRNDALIDSQTVGSDGRYAFRNVTILFGNNQFRLVFYGPQGQVEEITKTINAEASLLEKGEVNYNFSAGRKNESVFGVSPETPPTGISTVGEMEYGLTRNLTLTAGGARLPLLDGDHTYATAGLRASLLNSILASLDGAYDTSDSSYSLRAGASTMILDTLLSARQKVANEFMSEEEATLSSAIRRQTLLRADRQFGRVSASLSYDNREYESGRNEKIWINQLSGTVFNSLNLTNTVTYDHDDLGLDQITGAFFGRGYWKDNLLGAQLDYDLRPDREPRHLRLTVQTPLTPTFTNLVEFNTDLQGDKKKDIANTATFDMGSFKFSLTGRADDDGEFFAGLSLNTSFGRIPETKKLFFSSKSMAETGTIAVYPFTDKNYNQRRDPGETPPEGTNVKIGSQTLKLGKKGSVIASQLPVNLPLKITIDPANQEASPLWSTGVDAYTVVPRAGKIAAVDFPVFEASQVDGTVQVPEGMNPQGLVVELVDAEGQAIRSTRAVFDGYYLIEGIMPGTYKLRISDESLTGSGMRQDSLPELAVTTSDFFVKDIPLVAGDSMAMPAAAAAEFSPVGSAGLVEALTQSPPSKISGDVQRRSLVIINYDGAVPRQEVIPPKMQALPVERVEREEQPFAFPLPVGPKDLSLIEALAKLPAVKTPEGRPGLVITKD